MHNRGQSPILDIQDDFELCNEVFSRLCDSCNEIDVGSCAELERIVRLVWHSAGLIENGGFRYLFECDFMGDPGFVYTAAAYHRIGALRAYEAFQDAVRQFPGGVLPHDINERLRLYESVPQERWDEIAGRFWTRQRRRSTAWLVSYGSTEPTMSFFSKTREPNPAAIDLPPLPRHRGRGEFFLKIDDFLELRQEPAIDFRQVEDLVERVTGPHGVADEEDPFRIGDAELARDNLPRQDVPIAI